MKALEDLIDASEEWENEIEHEAEKLGAEQFSDFVLQANRGADLLCGIVYNLLVGAKIEREPVPAGGVR
jgi:hypothetical protein